MASELTVGSVKTSGNIHMDATKPLLILDGASGATPSSAIYFSEASGPIPPTAGSYVGSIEYDGLANKIIIGGYENAVAKPGITIARATGIATFPVGINLGNSTLSNYVEGIQVVIMTAASGTITLNGAVNTGQYTRIGRMVYYSGQLSVSSVSSPTGAIRITLPYAVGDTTDNAERSCGVCYVTGASSNNGNGVLLVDGGNTTAGIVVGVATNPVMQASAEIYFSISYIAA